MKYEFKKVNPEAVDNFAVKHGFFRQTSIWARMKKRYFKPLSFLGYDENGDVILSCLLLRFRIPLTPLSICYAPRGFVCDYNNNELITSFTIFYKRYMRKHAILYTIFDPEIVKRKDFKIAQPGNKKVEIFRSLGYKINGTDKPHVNIQNNNNYRLLIDYNSTKVIEDTFNNFDRKLQYNINLCQTRGVTVEKYDGIYYLEHPEIFEHFYNLVLETSKRKNFTEKLLSKEKYRTIIYTLSKYGHIYLAKYNYEIDYQNTIDLITKTKEELELLKDENSKKANGRIKELNKNMDSYQKRLIEIENHQDNPYIATAFFLVTGDQTHYLFGGNESSLRFAKPTSLMIWEMIKDTIEHGSKIFNTGGSLAFDSEKVEEDSMYSVYDFKKNMNGELVDFYGDFYLINNNVAFKLLEKKYKLLKRINNRY